MGFKFGYFLKGATTAFDQITDKAEEDNAKYVAETVKRAAESYATTQKEFEKQKTELSGVIGSLASIEFAEGKRLDDQQLIALASNPDAAKTLLEQIKKDPTITSKVSTDFVKAVNNIPVGKKPQEYINELFSRTKASDETVKKLFEPKEGATFIQKWGAQNNFALAEKAARGYGLTLNDLFSKGTPANDRVQNNVQVNFGALVKSDKFNDLIDKAQIEFADALQSGDEGRINAAKDTLSGLSMAKAAADVAGVPEARVQSNMVTRIQRLQSTGNPEDKQEAENLTVQLRQRQQLLDAKGGSDKDKVTVANLISVASKQLTNTLERSLPPGSYGLVKEDDGTVRAVLKNATPEQAKIFNKAVYDADQFIIKAFTKEDGTVKDVYHQLALNSRGIAVDAQSGKPIPPSAPAEMPRPGAGAAPARAGEARQPTAAPSRESRGVVENAPKAVFDFRQNSPEAIKAAIDKLPEPDRTQAMQQYERDLATFRASQTRQPAASTAPKAAPVAKWNPQTKRWE